MHMLLTSNFRAPDLGAERFVGVVVTVIRPTG
jgi:hypothetical protein